MGALLVAYRNRIGGAFDSQHAVVHRKIDPVLGRKPCEDTPTGVYRPEVHGTEGDEQRRRAASFGRQRGRFILGRRFGQRVDMRAVRPQHDQMHDEVARGAPSQIEGVHVGAPVHVGVERRTRIQVARIVLPLVRLASRRTEDLDAHVSGIAHHQPTVRKKRDGLGAAELARPLALPAQRLDVYPCRVENADVLGLPVEHVNVPVIVDGDRPDASEEILLGSVQLTDRDLWNQAGFGAPDASRQSPDHGRIADGFDDGFRSGAGRIRVGAAGREGACGRRSGQPQEIGSHGPVLPQHVKQRLHNDNYACHSHALHFPEQHAHPLLEDDIARYPGRIQPIEVGLQPGRHHPPRLHQLRDRLVVAVAL